MFDIEKITLPTTQPGAININSKLKIGDIVSALLPYIFTISGIILLLYLIYGGFQYMMSRGDPKAMQAAQGKITTAIIGFVIVFIAYWLVQLLGRILGIEIISSIFSSK